MIFKESFSNKFNLCVSASLFYISKKCKMLLFITKSKELTGSFATLSTYFVGLNIRLK